MELYFHTMIRQVDSSLLDEWEKMRNPDYQPRAEAKELRPPGAEDAPDLTRDTKAFTATIRTRIFMFLRTMAIADYEQAVASLTSAAPPEGEPWTADRFEQLMEEYYKEHQRLCLDPNARNLRHTYLAPSEDKRTLRVQQMLVDPEEHNDWVAEFEVDLAESRKSGEPVLRLRRLGSLV